MRLLLKLRDRRLARKVADFLTWLSVTLVFRSDEKYIADAVISGLILGIIVTGFFLALVIY